MSKELIEQLAKEYGGYRFRQHGDIGYSYQFTEPDLEAFAKAYQAAAPIGNDDERLVSYAPDKSTCTLNINGEEVYFNRALIPDTQVIKPKEGE